MWIIRKENTVKLLKMLKIDAKKAETWVLDKNS